MYESLIALMMIISFYLTYKMGQLQAETHGTYVKLLQEQIKLLKEQITLLKLKYNGGE